jgi:hypothetical protein
VYRTAAGCHSPVVVSGSDGNAFAEKSIETVNPLFMYRYFIVCAGTEAVYFMVMLLPYQNQSQKAGNHQATGITAHMGCKFGK